MERRLNIPLPANDKRLLLNITIYIRFKSPALFAELVGENFNNEMDYKL